MRQVRDRCVYPVANALSSHTPPRAWLASAFAEFTPLRDDRGMMLTKIAAHFRPAAARLDDWLEGRDGGRGLAAALLEAVVHLDDGTIWHTSLKLRSYVDVSIQAMTLRLFAEQLAELAATTMPVEARDVTALVLEHQPSSRPALLAHAELLLAANEVDAALESIRRALRVQAVCTTAEQMLFRALALKREQGSTAPELDMLDYDLGDKFCRIPFTHLSTGFRGDTFACSCPSWVPFSIGNVFEARSPDEVWNSEVAMEIRRSILDGDFSHCSRTQCSFIRTRKLPRRSDITNPVLRGYIDNHITRIEERPEMVELNHDPTCNLACPSCRTEIVAATAEDVDAYADATERVILPLLRGVNGHTYITGGGEAFASKHFRSILRALNREEYPGLRVYLITNAQLITPRRWSEFPNLPGMLAVVSVSVDAARAETYERLRRPGKWSTLMRNLEFIAGMRRRGEIPAFGLNFVVQQANFREILEFVDLADSLGVDQIWLQRAVNYGAYDEATFAAIDVSNPSHPEHEDLLAILRSPVLARPTLNMNMLQSLLPEFVASDQRLEFLY